MTPSAFLIVATLASTAGAWSFKPYPFPSGMEACRQSIASSKTDLAKGGDAEAGVLLFCSETEWPDTIMDMYGDIKKRKREK